MSKVVASAAIRGAHDIYKQASDFLNKAIKEKGDATISLSRMTFPHQITRLILVEQVYRACTILKNEKYHH